jgi:hypothetical protein
MAKIPDFQQQQRLSASGPNQVASPAEARRMGDQIAETGGQIMDFGSKLGTFLEERQRVQDINEQKRFSDDLELKMQEFETDIKTNRKGEVAADGSNIIDLFNEKVGSIETQVDGIEDGHKRRLAKDVVQNLKVKYGNSLSDHQVARFNGDMFRQANLSNMKMSAKIAAKPELRAQYLAEQEQYLASLPLGGENMTKMLTSARELAADAAIEGVRGDEKKVTALLNGELADQYTPDQKRQLIDYAISRENSKFSADKARRENAESIRVQNEKDTKRAAHKQNLADVLSGDPVRVAKAIDDAAQNYAKGIYDKSDYEAIIEAPRVIQYKDSEEVAVLYSKRIQQHIRLDEAIDEIAADKRLHPNTRRALIGQVNTQIRAQDRDPNYKTKVNRGKILLKAAFQPDRWDFPEDKAKKAQLSVRAMEEQQRLLDDGVTDNYDEAARMAIIAVDPANKILIGEHLGDGKKTDKDLTKEYVALEQEAKRLESQHQMTKELEADYMKRMSILGKRIEAMRVLQEMNAAYEAEAKKKKTMKVEDQYGDY